MDKHSIAIITPTRFPGTAGDTANFTELINQLISEGVHVTLFCPKTTEPNYSSDIKNLEIVRIPYSSPRLEDIAGGIGIGRKLQFIVFVLLESFIVAWGIKKRGIKHAFVRHTIQTMQLSIILKLMGIVTIADGQLVCDSLRPHIGTTLHKLLRTIERHMLSYYSFFKVSSQVQARSLQYFGFPPTKILEIPVSVNIDKLPKTDILDIPNNTFGYFGLLERWQGVDLLVDAFQILLKKIPSSNLFIIGKGSMSNQIDEKIHHEKLTENITMISSISRETLWNIYFSKFRFVVIPRLRQNNMIDDILPIKLVEAMAASKPIIAADIPVMCEVPNDAIMLFNSGDANSLARCMEKLCTDAKLASMLSQNGRKFASRFDIKVNIKKVMGIFQD